KPAGRRPAAPPRRRSRSGRPPARAPDPARRARSSTRSPCVLPPPAARECGRRWCRSRASACHSPSGSRTSPCGGPRRDGRLFPSSPPSPRGRLLDLRGTGRPALLAHVLVLVAVEEHQEEPLPHWHRLPAVRTEEEARLQRFVCLLSLHLARGPAHVRDLSGAGRRGNPAPQSVSPILIAHSASLSMSLFGRSPPCY